MRFNELLPGDCLISKENGFLVICKSCHTITYMRLWGGHRGFIVYGTAHTATINYYIVVRST